MWTHPFTLILEMPIETNKEQFECLGSIGNYHLTPYPDSNSNVPKLIDPKSHIGYNRHPHTPHPHPHPLA